MGPIFRLRGGDDGSDSDADRPNRRRTALFDRLRTDRASVNGNVRYVFLGAMSVIGTAIVVNVLF